MARQAQNETSETNQTAERELIQRAKAGDQEAFGELYERYVDRVFRMIRLRVSTEVTAEDLTSEVFMKAWDGLDGYRERGYSFGAWLFRIARNLVIDHYRTAKESQPLEEAERESTTGGVEDSVARRELAEQIQGKLSALTEDQRAVLELKFLMGLSTDEVGRALGKRQGAVRALQMRGLQALAKITEGADD